MLPITAFLTDEEIDAARKLAASVPDHEFAKRCSKEIISPVIARINKTLNQENDPTYLAYLCQYQLGQEKK